MAREKATGGALLPMDRFKALLEAQEPLRLELEASYAAGVEALLDIRNREADVMDRLYETAEAIVTLGGDDPRDINPIDRECECDCDEQEVG